MTMIGINCEWRMTWTKQGVDQFAFVHEERDDDGSWAHIDEWRLSSLWCKSGYVSAENPDI
jgi:hypothetical protein